MLIMIYEYDRIAGAENTLTYLAAVVQPLAGGCDAEQSARILKPVHTVDSIDAARLWITRQIWAMVPVNHLPGVTKPAYTLREVPHSQALLYITAEGAQPDDDGYHD